MIFYPLSGFIADVCCGRLKIVVVSLVILLFCLIILLIALQLRETKVAPSFDSDHVFSYKQGVSVINARRMRTRVTVVTLCVCVCVLVTSFS